MPQDVHERSEVQALMDRGAQVVEVLGAEEFGEDHLPGAINLPLRKIDAEAKGRLDAEQPVLVYCWDSA
jgi:rhodanese-related sulfurtransferase